MADEADIANEYLAREFNSLIQGVRDSLSSGVDASSLAPAGVRRCIECDELISEARIRVVPNAVLCVDCMNEREESLKRH